MAEDEEYLDTVFRRGKLIWETLAQQLRAEHPGKSVAIEPETGNWFIGATDADATSKAAAQYPHTTLHVVDIDTGRSKFMDELTFPFPSSR